MALKLFTTIRVRPSRSMLYPIKFSLCGILAFAVVFALYCYVAKFVFDLVNKTSNMVIDEAFHLPQGKLYCNFEFDKVGYCIFLFLLGEV